jgi:hypothetical protein
MTHKNEYPSGKVNPDLVPVEIREKMEAGEGKYPQWLQIATNRTLEEVKAGIYPYQITCE